MRSLAAIDQITMRLPFRSRLLNGGLLFPSSVHWRHWIRAQACLRIRIRIWTRLACLVMSTDKPIRDAFRQECRLLKRVSTNKRSVLTIHHELERRSLCLWSDWLCIQFNALIHTETFFVESPQVTVEQCWNLEQTCKRFEFFVLHYIRGRVVTSIHFFQQPIVIMAMPPSKLHLHQ